MAGGTDGNQSQFFITLTATPQLDRQHTIFGKLTGNAIYNILQVNDLELNGDRPVQPPKILSIDVLANPFDDIVPRAKKTQSTLAAPVNTGPKIKKNYKLLSFGDEAEEEEREADEEGPKTKLAPAHSKPTPMMLEAQRKRARINDDHESARTNALTTNDEQSHSSDVSDSRSGSDDDNDNTDDRPRKLPPPQTTKQPTSRQSSTNNNSNASKLPPQKPLINSEQAEEEQRLRDEIRAMRDSTANEQRERDQQPIRSQVELTGEYAVGEARERYASKAVRDKKQREAAALKKLNLFSSKLKAAASSTTTKTTSMAPPINDSSIPEYCALHNKRRCATCYPDIDEQPLEDDPTSIMAHALKFEKEAKTLEELARQHANDYDVYDPLDPESIAKANKRSSQQAKAQQKGSRMASSDSKSRGGAADVDDWRAARDSSRKK